MSACTLVSNACWKSSRPIAIYRIESAASNERNSSSTSRHPSNVSNTSVTACSNIMTLCPILDPTRALSAPASRSRAGEQLPSRPPCFRRRWLPQLICTLALWGTRDVATCLIHFVALCEQPICRIVGNAKTWIFYGCYCITVINAFQVS